MFLRIGQKAVSVQTLFNMPSFGPNYQRSSVQPLVYCFVYQFLADLFPTAR